MIYQEGQERGSWSRPEVAVDQIDRVDGSECATTTAFFSPGTLFLALEHREMRVLRCACGVFDAPVAPRPGAAAPRVPAAY